MTKYKTVKRKATVGERILIVDAFLSGTRYKNGDVLTVISETGASGSNDVIRAEGVVYGVFDYEYEVIVGDRGDEISDLTVDLSLREAYEKGYSKGHSEGYEKGKFGQRMETAFDEIAKITRGIGVNLEKTAQERRDEIVGRAKADIEDLKGELRVRYLSRIVEFVINKDTRTVEALLRGRSTGTLYARGNAKCAPDECFNVHIGKAIALRRALGLEVPDEYIRAPQPTEVRVGDVVKGAEFSGYYRSSRTFTLTKERKRGSFYYEECCKYDGCSSPFIHDWIESRGLGEIIDDSREEGE